MHKMSLSYYALTDELRKLSGGQKIWLIIPRWATPDLKRFGIPANIPLGLARKNCKY